MDFRVDIFLEALTSKSLRDGALIAVALTIVSFVAGSGIGLIVALGRTSRFRAVRVLAWLYIWLFRALPTLVILFIVWYALPQLIPALRGPQFLPFYAAALGLSVNEAAYAAEIIRGGLLAVDDGQRLAARALGMSPSSVFRRIGAPRVVRSLIEGESLFNDATALVTYRFAVIAAVSGTFVLAEAAGGFVAAIVGGLAIGWLVGRGASELVRRLDNPTVEVAVSLLIPYAAYLPAEQLGVSGVLGAVVAGLIVGRRLGTILSPNSRILWLTTWKMLGFLLNGFTFILIGLQLPDIVAGLGGYTPAELVGLAALVIGVVVVARLAWAFLSSFLP